MVSVETGESGEGRQLPSEFALPAIVCAAAVARKKKQGQRRYASR